MPFKTFTAGEILTAADTNTFLARQAVITCTSTTRPSSPPEGMVIHESDTDRLLVFSGGASAGWQPPWNLPWGPVQVATLAANYPTTTGEADITSLSATFTAVANRRYRTMMVLSVGNTGGAVSTVTATITDPSNTRVGRAATTIPAAATTDITTWAYETGLSGSVTRKGRIAASQTGQVNASAALPAFLIVEDIGPSGAPA
jgi:hypothetical protein